MEHTERPEPAVIAPTEIGDRVVSLDVIRGVAVLGILLMNIVGFGLPSAAYFDPTAAGGAEGRIGPLPVLLFCGWKPACLFRVGSGYRRPGCCIRDRSTPS